MEEQNNLHNTRDLNRGGRKHIEQLSKLSGSQNFTGIPYRSMKDKIFTQILEDHIIVTHDSNFYDEIYR